MNNVYTKAIIMSMIIISLLFSLYFCNANLAKTRDIMVMPSGILFLKSLILLLIGASLCVTVSQWRFFRPSPQSFVLLIFSILLFAVNYATGVYYKELIVWKGIDNKLVLAILDSDNKVVLSMLSGYWLMHSFIKKKA